MNRLSFACFIIALPSVLIAQSIGQRTDLDVVVRELAEEQEETNLEEYIERLTAIYEQPFQINHMSQEDLEELYFLNAAQIDAILEYIEMYRPVLSIYELQTIEEISREDLEKLALFVSTDMVSSKRSSGFFRRGTTYVLTRSDKTLEQKRGYSVDTAGLAAYDGSPYRHMIKFKSYRRNNYSLGVTGDKDAGESFRFSPSNRKYGFDHLSAHLYLENAGPFKRLALGDYKANFGQGLAIGAGFHFGKMPDAIASVRRKAPGLKPYASAGEAGYFRGIAGTAGWRNFEATLFYSGKKIDARMAGGEPDEYAASLNVTGLHRTSSELAYRQTLGERTWGGNVSYSPDNQRFTVGANVIETRLSAPLLPDTTVYNQFYFRGRRSSNASLYAEARWRATYLFGELANSGADAWAGVAGLQSHLSPVLSASLLYRNYAKNYQAFYASPFAESSYQNEEGFYWGLRIKPNRLFEINVYYDIFSFPWLRYQVYAPSQGAEFLIRAQYRPGDRIKAYAQVKNERKESNLPDGPVRSPATYSKTNYQAHFDYLVGERLRMTTKMQLTDYYQTNRSSGFSIAQDAIFSFSPVILSTRLYYFNIADFDARHYVYERDVLYGFSYPSFFDNGLRWYMLAQLKPSGNLSCWLKIARTQYFDRETIGSGQEEIAGSKKTDIKLQVRYKF